MHTTQQDGVCLPGGLRSPRFTCAHNRRREGEKQALAPRQQRFAPRALASALRSIYTHPLAVTHIHTLACMNLSSVGRIGYDLEEEAQQCVIASMFCVSLFSLNRFAHPGVLQDLKLLHRSTLQWLNLSSDPQHFNFTRGDVRQEALSPSTLSSHVLSWHLRGFLSWTRGRGGGGV